jgi:hypothetical protein
MAEQIAKFDSGGFWAATRAISNAFASLSSTGY